MKVESEKNCGDCYFLKKHANIPSDCERYDKPIYQVKFCSTGPMIQRPKTIDEVIALGNQIIFEVKNDRSQDKT